MLFSLTEGGAIHVCFNALLTHRGWGYVCFKTRISTRSKYGIVRSFRYYQPSIEVQLNRPRSQAVNVLKLGATRCDEQFGTFMQAKLYLLSFRN